MLKFLLLILVGILVLILCALTGLSAAIRRGNQLPDLDDVEV